MNKAIFAAICLLYVNSTLALAQPSQAKGGSPVTGETADVTKNMGSAATTSTRVPPTDSPGNTAAPNPTNPATGAPVPNVAVSKPGAEEAAPAGR